MATVTFELPTDHPGFADTAYRERRAAIAAVGRSYEPGDRIPDVVYTAQEDEVWRVVSTELAAKHRAVACREYLRGSTRLVLAEARVPQLRDVDQRLHALTGFHIRPVAGLVPAVDFYASLADRTFMSTQYIRHHSAPFYTPEPDVGHEIIGHANMLASEPLAALYERAGRASLRCTNEAAMDFFSKVFWFTLEFGVVRESGELKAYGAGLLSSYGELDAFGHAELRPFDIGAMGTLDYDISHYQPVLFEAPSFDGLVDELSRFFDEFGDDWHRDHSKGEQR
ncbi:MAG: phenylalanine 4-monooxygenase [Acidimicrobiales bacterium]